MGIFGKWGGEVEQPATALLGLGDLETTVMELMWRVGEGNVREVASQLARPLAYTTVMTTLDRLYKKGLLIRRKQERAFLYSPRMPREQWQHERAGNVLAGLLSGPVSCGDALVSCLVDVFERHDAALLDRLEEQISRKRKELERGKKA